MSTKSMVTTMALALIVGNAVAGTSAYATADHQNDRETYYEVRDVNGMLIKTNSTVLTETSATAPTTPVASLPYYSTTEQSIFGGKIVEPKNDSDNR